MCRTSFTNFILVIGLLKWFNVFMKQYPSFLKFKKNHRINYSNLRLVDNKNFFPIKGSYFLKIMEAGKLNFKQIESCRKSIRRSLKKEGNLLLEHLQIFL